MIGPCRIAISVIVLTLAAALDAGAICSFTVTNPSHAILLDPMDGTDSITTTTLGVTCTNTRNRVRYSADNGLNWDGTNRRLAHTTVAGEFVPYSLAYPDNNTQFQALPVPGAVRLDVTILGTDYVNALVGDYTDSLVIDVTP